MIHDLSAIAVAFLLWPMLAIAPGYVATLVFDPLDVRRRSWGFRLMLSVILSFCVAPILLHWLWRFGGVSVAWSAVAACSIVTLAHVVRSAGGVADALRRYRFEFIACAIWLAIVLAVMLPIQIGDRLFLSYSWIDYSKHVALTSAISRTGVPPVNPYYAPGHAMPTYYYYGWFLMSSLVHQAGRGWLSPGNVLLAGAAWTSIAMWATLILFDRQLVPTPDAIDARRRRRWVLALVCVTGLDAIAVLPRVLSAFLPGKDRLPYRSVESWNEQVTAWTDVAIWVPQHVAGIVSALMGLMLIRAAFPRPASGDATAIEPWFAPRAMPWKPILLAGITFGSCLFVSVYLGMAAVVGAATWGLWCIVRRHRLEFAALAIAGGLACVLCVPYLLELRAAQLVDAKPLGFSVRAFGPVTSLFARTPESLLNYHIPGEAPPTTVGHQLAFLACLPINYALEFGFYAFVAWVYIRHIRPRGSRLTTEERFALALGGSVLLLCTFVKSALVYNDLGWRAMHVTQAVLLVMGVSVMMRIDRLAPWIRRVTWTLLVLGVVSTLANFAMLRGVVFWDAARGVARDRTRDAAALREAHQWIAKNTPKDAIVQYDPIVPYGPFHGDYGERQVPIGDPEYGTVLGIPRKLYMPWKERLDGLFSSTRFTSEKLAVLHDLHVTHLIVMDSDALWAARAQVPEAIVHENAKVAVFDVSKLPQ